ncbi:MAG: 4a-hydroxytetrahydrobiopterin dehydratase [Sporichthyaceae bacterium]|nr:4a-hydroxytetrahydrobiopterin dehydratase [Sporichthyaceae bacterium]
MAELLSRDDIDTALAALPGWSCEDDKLVKRARVALDSQDGLVEAVSQVADAMDHHPVVSRDNDSVTFRLWTHSAGGVTAKDIDLAARIDRELSGAGRDEGS